jgi:glycosyltransferase involved in cell wall biosynthesis
MTNPSALTASVMSAASATPRPANPLISLVVPCYNEEATIRFFMDEANRVMAGHRLEFVFVNGGSRDNTLAVLTALAGRDPRVRVVNFTRNFGKEAALTAGLDHTRGDVVIPMDADLQDPFETVLLFLEKWREGYDVVNGFREDRASDTLVKRQTAKWFYSVFNAVADNAIPENVGDFRLLDARVVETLRALPERSRFMKGLFAWVGYTTAQVAYVRPPRKAGEAKFNFWGLWRLALEGIFNFSSAPLRVWGYLGLATASFAFFYAVIIVSKTLIFGRDVPGYASLITIMLFLGGLQLLTLGIIGEYLSRVFAEVKGRPVYVIDRIYEGTPDADTNSAS